MELGARLIYCVAQRSQMWSQALMRAVRQAAVTSIAILAVAACSPTIDWRAYPFPKQGFTAQFPIKPKVSDKEGEPWHADAIIKQDIYTVSVYCDPSTDDTAEDIVANGVAFWSSKYTVASQTDVKAGRTSGKELLVTEQKAPSAKVRIFAHHQCLYMVSAVVTKGPNDPTVPRFLNSFQLTS
jgi:hypothetical protein